MTSPPPYGAPPPDGSGRQGPSRPEPDSSGTARVWFVLLPVLSAGVASPALPVWAAVRARAGRSESSLHSSHARGRLYGHAAAFAGLVVVAMLVGGLAPKDASGQVTGPLGGLQSFALLANFIASIVYAVRFRWRVFPRTPPPRTDLGALPGVQQARARRNLREQYRALAAADPLVAAEIGVGRPDRTRDYEDGGLVAVNLLDAGSLVLHGGLTPDEAQELVVVRERFGRLGSADEIRVHTRLSDESVERLREYGLY